MAKLLLVFLNNEYRPMVPPNLVDLEGFVRKHGHEVRVFDTSFYADVLNLGSIKRNVEVGSYFGVDYSAYGVSIKEGSSTEDLLKAVADFNPDIVGFGVYGYTEKKADELAAAVKRKFRNVPILYGGIETTINPQKAIAKEWVDLICCGEGEGSLLDICNAIDNNSGDFSSIENIWVKDGGRVIRNSLRQLIDPDTLPLPDWSSYAPYQHYGPIEGRIYKLGMVMFGRGCPYSCSYCESVLVREAYFKAGIKKYVRHKSPEKFVNDCAHLVEAYGIEFFYFTDGTFLTMTDDVLEKLSHLFKSKVNKPFLCLTTVPSVTGKRARLLKEMGCFQVNMGIEAGSQRYRKEILNRPNMSNENIAKAFKAMKDAGIRVSAYNMIGIPWQDRNGVFETIKLNRRCRPDRTNVSIYIPFEGTHLTERLRKEGYVTKDTELGDETVATVKVPGDMSLEEIQGLHRTFNLYCKAPRVLFPLLRACEKESRVSKFVLEKLRDIYLPNKK